MLSKWKFYFTSSDTYVRCQIDIRSVTENRGRSGEGGNGAVGGGGGGGGERGGGAGGGGGGRSNSMASGYESRCTLYSFHQKSTERNIHL